MQELFVCSMGDVLVVACRLFGGGMWDPFSYSKQEFNCGMGDLK